MEVRNATSYTSSERYWSKPNAIKALYSVESVARESKDEFGITNSLEVPASQDRKPVAKIPILVAEGMRGPLSVDTEENSDTILLIRG